MSRTMYDACDYTRPPADATMVAGYLTGQCAWRAEAWHVWSRITAVRIATVASFNGGQVLDVERGDATPDDAPGWCARARLRGQIPTVYTSQSNVDAVLAACKLHGVAPPLIWVAQWDGVAVLPPLCVAKQYVNEQPPGCDTSVVADYWPGVDPAPSPSVEVEPMELFVAPIPVGVWCLDRQTGRYFHVATPPDEATFAAIAGGPPRPISPEQHAILLDTYPSPAVATAGAVS